MIGKKLLNEFKPDLIGMSSTEDMWELGLMVLEEGREYIKKNNTKVIAGGYSPHLLQKFVLSTI